MCINRMIKRLVGSRAKFLKWHIRGFFFLMVMAQCHMCLCMCVCTDTYDVFLMWLGELENLGEETNKLGQ